MFPGAPPAVRVVLRHRKGALLGASLAIFLVYFNFRSKTPAQPQDVTVVYPDPVLIPDFNTPPSAAPIFLSPRPQSALHPDPCHQPPTKALIIARTHTEDISWIHEPLDPSSPSGPSLADIWTPYIYTTDSLSSPDPDSLHTPIHKGREAMAYLTYLIDHYAALPTITLFLHAHRTSWHDNLFGLDTPQMLRRLNVSRILTSLHGYVNLRCGWTPGCPEHIHPGEAPFDAAKPEQVVFADAWTELFPGTEVPVTLSQPCCAQFAVLARTVRRRARAEYVFWREWLMGTGLEDEVSGRVMEYVYQCAFLLPLFFTFLFVVVNTFSRTEEGRGGKGGH